MTWWPRRRPVSPPAAPVPDPLPDADSAWKALALVVDWIKHAETKAVGTLAASGVLGGVLFTLVRAERDPNLPFGIAATATAVFLLGAGLGAGLALRPRMRSPEEPTSLLYYDHIVRSYRTRVDAYAGAMNDLLRDPSALIAAIANQVWANAHVARRKYLWSSVGVLALLMALASLAVAATLSAFGTN